MENRFAKSFLFPVPLSDLFSETTERNNNYLFEGCSQTLNYKTGLIILEDNELSTCRFIDFFGEDWQVGAFFRVQFVLRCAQFKVTQSIFLCQETWNENATTVIENDEEDQYKLPQLGRGEGALILHFVYRRLHLQRTFWYWTSVSVGELSDPLPGGRGENLGIFLCCRVFYTS